MNVLIVPDKFKGSLTASEVTEAIRAGLSRVSSEINPHEIAASDGGDGFLSSIERSSMVVEKVAVETVDALGRKIDSVYLFAPNTSEAYVEMATASGMELLAPSERNPMATSTYGTGLLVRHALERGARRIFVGLGGSATNDGGTGLAAALGYGFFDAKGNEVKPVGGNLGEIVAIETSGVVPGLGETEFRAVNDVSNPLCGPEGAAYVYARQKGATEADLPMLDRGLFHLQSVVRNQLGIDAAAVPGAGAAGGLGYGLRAFCGAEFVSGVDFVLGLTGMDDLLASGEIDYIVTGEGRIDDQTAYGKLVHGVASAGARYGVPVVAVCGILALEHNSVPDLGLLDAIQIHDNERAVEETIERAAELIEIEIADWFQTQLKC